MYQELEVALRRYESGDFSGVLELQSILNILRRTHAALSEYISLDSFDSLLAEVSVKWCLWTFQP